MKTKKTIKEELEKIFSKETIEQNSLQKLVGGNDTDGINTSCPSRDNLCKDNCFVKCTSFCFSTNCYC